MLISWVYFRLWFFPVYIIYHLYWECYSSNKGAMCPNVNFQMLNMLMAFIIGLLCLHVFWFFLMVQGLLRRSKSKKGFAKAVSLKTSENRSTTTDQRKL
jgi:hypothetical protein